MSNSLGHLRQMKRRQTMTHSLPTGEMSTEDKVGMLEQTLSSFRNEVDMKLRIMQQMLTTRNEQLSVQKTMMEREKAVYDNLLRHWKNASNLTATGYSENFSSGEIYRDSVHPDAENPNYGHQEETPGPSPKKSKSNLRRQRNSAKTTPRQKSKKRTKNSHSAYRFASNALNENYTTGSLDEMSCTTSYDEVEADDDGDYMPINPPVQVQMKTEPDDENDCGSFKNFEEYNAEGVNGPRPRNDSFSPPESNEIMFRCPRIREGIVCGTELRETTRKNRKGEEIPCLRCPKRGCQSYVSMRNTHLYPNNRVLIQETGFMTRLDSSDISVSLVENTGKLPIPL